jgi:hypothetical protein
MSTDASRESDPSREQRRLAAEFIATAKLITEFQDSRLYSRAGAEMARTRRTWIEPSNV